MITINELKQRLEAVFGEGNVAYRSFPKDYAPPLPFAVYYINGSDNFGADNRVYAKINQCVIEVYTELKNIALENSVEDALSDIFWSKTEAYIDDEKMYQIAYQIEVK